MRGEERAGPGALPIASHCRGWAGSPRGWAGSPQSWAGSPRSCLQPGLLADACSERRARLRRPCRFAFPWLGFYVPDPNRLTVPTREKACDCSRRPAFAKGCTERDHAAGRELLRCPMGGHRHATQALFSLRPSRGCSSPPKGLAGEDGGWLPGVARARAGRPPTPGRWYATSNSSLPPQEGAQAPLVEHRWLCSPLPGLSCAGTALFFSTLV